MTTTTQQYDWQEEQSIKRQEFEAGYWDESSAESESPTERATNDASELAVEPKTHTHGQTAASETTLWADGGVPDHWSSSYDPNERLLDGRTRRQKYADLWKYNAGHDSWRAGRKSREECNKADENATYKQRFTESVCDSLELSTTATERATDLAGHDAPRQLNFLGGLPLWVLACVLIAANEHGDVLRLNTDALERLREQHGVTVENLAKGTDMVVDIVE